MSPRLVRIVRKLALSLGVLVLLFGVAELVARHLEPGPFDLLDRNPYFDDPERPGMHRHRPGFEGRWDGTWYALDSRGLRGPELEPTFAADELRVVALGDSCTFGKGVVEVHTWPRQLEARLAQRLKERSVLVANLGVNGYSGATYDYAFQDLAAELRPQIVVVGYNLNDFPNAIRAVDEHVFQKRGLRQALSQGLRDFMGRSALYRLARQSYYHSRRESDWQRAEDFARGAADDTGNAEVWAAQERHLASIRDRAAEHGGRVAVFLFPYESLVYLDAYDTTPIERLRALCEKLGLPFVDLAEEFRGRARSQDPPRELFLRGDRYHPNPEGYGIVAERVATELERRGWLSSEGE